jgi:hypothetical protein
MTVDLSYAAWLKSPALYALASSTGVAWGEERSVAAEFMSPYDLRSDAAVEAARHMGFLQGPNVKERIVVKGRRRDLLFKCVAVAADRLGYQSVPEIETVTNGTFDTNTAGWTAAAGATLSNPGGRLRVTGSATPYGGGRQIISLVPGVRYSWAYTVIARTVGDIFQISPSGFGPIIGVQGAPLGVAKEGIFTATQISYEINAGIDGTVGTVDFDNISVKPRIERVFVIGVAETDHNTTVLTVLRKL